VWGTSQLLQNTPLHPIAEWGRQRFDAEAPADERLADLEGTLRLVGLDPDEHAPLLAPLVDIPLPPERAANFPPEELRRRQMAAMTAWALAGARSQPIVLAFEDLHWADPTSLDLLRALAERGAQAPLLILATTRPEFRPPWSLRSHHSVISLAPLDRAGVARMVNEISARHALPKDVIDGVSERTGGVPLFIEEVTRLLLERGVEGGAQAIPPTLQQSLAARLDRLGPAREIAQIGAVLGREFSYGLLLGVAAVAGVADLGADSRSLAADKAADTDRGSSEASLQSALERLAEADLLIAEGVGPQANYRFKHALIQDAAYDSLLKSRRQALHRRAAEVLRDDPERAAAEPELIAHHFTEASLDDFAIEWWGKAGDQALRRSAFQEAIAHLGKAIAMADKAGSPQAGGVSGQRQHLHVAYGNALIAARGYGALETTAAFAKARESARGEKDAPERLAADYGLWIGSFTRGELAAMRAHAAACLRDVEAKPDSPEAGVAHRVCGQTHWFAGEYLEARDHLERALALFQPGRDDDLAFHFGQDTGVAAMSYLALTLWPLGTVERAVSLVRDAEARSAALTHIGTRAYGTAHAAMFELLRGDFSRAAPKAFELVRLAREHDLAQWRAFGVFFEGLARTETGAPGSGLEGMRRGAELLREQSLQVFDELNKVALAEAEARAGDVERAVATLDEALATSDRIGHRAFDAELHRVRGEMLLKRDPAIPAPAEEAFQAAIAVAKQQGTRSFELRAALSLAKLYQLTGRSVEAHAVLAPALEGFSPTPEMLEIAEAQALLAALAQTEEVKATLASRERRLHLQTAYAHAVLWSKGYGADETKAAFERTGDLATGLGLSAERFPAYYGQWAWSMLRGDIRAARGIAEAFLRAAEATGGVAEIGVAHRVLGLAYAYLGNLAGAQSQLELAVNSHDHEPDSEVRERFGFDSGVATRANLAYASCLSGDLHRARRLIEEAMRLARELAHLPSTMNALVYKGLIEIERNDLDNLVADAETLLMLSQQHGMEMYAAWARIYLSWAHARLGDARQGTAELRESLAAFTSQGNQLGVPGYLVLLAELEAAAGNAEGALTLIDNGLATAQEGGQHYADSFLHRLRGDILLKRDPADPAPAEEAYRTAIVIAKQQAARSYELLAALSLAKLYQSTGRLVDAHAILAPALEGFSSTSEMPEIAEAQALLSRLV
jgi:predicted ATPase